MDVQQQQALPNPYTLEQWLLFQHPPRQATPTGAPTLLWLRRIYNLAYGHGITAEQCATAAGVPLSVYFAAEIGSTISADEAKKILAAFSRVLDVPFRHEDVYLQVMP